MLFNSPEFLFCYLPLVLLGYAVAARVGRAAVVFWLAAASIAFYAYWRPAFVVLLLGSVLANYLFAHAIWKSREKPTLQRLLLCAGVTANLVALGYFKYFFPLLHFIETTLGLHTGPDGIILPLGISFFTFTQIAYLIDLADEEAAPQDLPGYILFVTFFPHLIAGPILHHREIMPQFAEGRTFRLRLDDVTLGFSWFILGLCKKVLIADRFAPHADYAFAHPHELGLTGAWVGVLNYAMQLYFDFSGYSDMAIGLARMFSIEFPFNFNSPYKSKNIIEFWSRWHMTLTRYLTMYIYNPVSMKINRMRAARGKPTSRKVQRTLMGFSTLVALPTLVTMFLAGLWHGAGFQFVIFGLLHGIYLSINHAWRIFRKEDSIAARVLNWAPASIALTFLAVLAGQVFFRSASTGDACEVIGALLGLQTAPAHVGGTVTNHELLFLLALPIVWLFPNTQEILGQASEPLPRNSWRSALLWKASLPWAGALGSALIAVLWYMTDTSSFLYFQF
jgi:alginate O-acetyltransferase complex protein AlgI